MKTTAAFVIFGVSSVSAAPLGFGFGQFGESGQAGGLLGFDNRYRNGASFGWGPSIFGGYRNNNFGGYDNNRFRGNYGNINNIYGTSGSPFPSASWGSGIGMF